MHFPHFDMIVVGGGHAGAEAAWAGCNLGAQVALVTMDKSKIGAMSCNPAIGGLAKGQIVREVDALGGLMAIAADNTGIQFRILNASKGPAVRGPRCQSDKYAYAGEVRRLLETRENLTILEGTVEEILVNGGKTTGIMYTPCTNQSYGVSPRSTSDNQPTTLHAPTVILTTGTFMRGLMHTGPAQTPGGRVGESVANNISASLANLGFELGRLKTGTPPRLDANTINYSSLDLQPGDDDAQPFSDLTDLTAFPTKPQLPCHITHTNPDIHELILSNLDRAPLYNGQIAKGSVGPRYCPSIEDKVKRFSDRKSHHVFLEPESLSTDEVYCNGISTSLPKDIQDFMVANLPGCENAKILRYGYAVEYDMVPAHQIDATCMTKRVAGLFFAGQINGTSGYEEAAAQGLLAGLNAIRYTRNQPLVMLRRDQAYIGVLMDDLVTKVPLEPYRMFTSRAEHRLMLRADNADHRLTELGREWGLVCDTRYKRFKFKQAAKKALTSYLENHKHDGQSLLHWIRKPHVEPTDVLAKLDGDPLPPEARELSVIANLLGDIKYEGFIDRQKRDIEKLAEQETVSVPVDFDYHSVTGLRNEAAAVMQQFKPTTLGQAGRLAGVTPADVMVLSVALSRSGLDRT